jgi:hypothetical protein
MHRRRRFGHACPNSIEIIEETAMITTILFPKSKTLPELAAEITTFEKAKGPLEALGRTETETAATFKPGRHPTKDLQIAEVKPPNATKVCDGKVWSANVKVDVVAYRA